LSFGQKQDSVTQTPKRIVCLGSIYPCNPPLYIINGIPVDEAKVANLNPKDIKSIEVLKDSSSTAIYGDKGTSGVVLITTNEFTKKRKKRSN
jgi:Ca-activated chloride channel family protein